MRWFTSHLCCDPGTSCALNPAACAHSVLICLACGVQAMARIVKEGAAEERKWPGMRSNLMSQILFIPDHQVTAIKVIKRKDALHGICVAGRLLLAVGVRTPSKPQQPLEWLVV